MVLKKAKGLGKPKGSPKQRAPPAPLSDMPDLDVGASEARGATLKSNAQAPSRSLTEDARAALDGLSYARDDQSRTPIATLPIHQADSLVDGHAKAMATISPRCADLLRAKYALLEGSQLCDELVMRDESTLVALLACTAKSSRQLTMISPSSQPIVSNPLLSLSHLFEIALSASGTWPNPLKLDLDNAACSRELELPYKDERERVNIMALHSKAQVGNLPPPYDTRMCMCMFEPPPVPMHAPAHAASRQHGASCPVFNLILAISYTCMGCVGLFSACERRR